MRAKVPPLCFDSRLRIDAKQVLLAAQKELIIDGHRGCDDAFAHLVFRKQLETAIDLRDEYRSILARGINFAIPY